MTLSRSFAAIACAVLLVIYAAIAWTAVRGKSPTYDEPVHAVASLSAIRLHDFRLCFDNPPLWDYWVALPSANTPLKIDTTSRDWALLPDDDVRQYHFATKTLYQTPGNNPDSFITRGRFMMLLIAVMLGTIIARWAGKLGGGTAAVAATFLFCFDPNFLAHGALLKNDVVIAFLMTAMAYAMWRLGKSATIWRTIIVGLLCGAACSVKFSGLFLPFIAACLLVSRILIGGRWPAFGKSLGTHAQRSIASLTIALLITAVTFITIWASYGFRFSVSPDTAVRINTARLVTRVERARAHADPLASDNATGVTAAVVWMLYHRLLPEPWLNGLLVIDAATLDRPSFVLGRYSNHAWWWYYPAAMFFKTPISTMIAMIAALALMALRFGNRATLTNVVDTWSTICLLCPPLVYMCLAVFSPTAVGLRHILPVYPFLFITLGWAAGILWRNWPGRIFSMAIAVGLICETLMVYPNFIPFFNVAVGGERAGIDLLSDSNLDWGQDLPLLAEWQRENPNRKLYLCYFGTADPAFYGIRYANLPGGFDLGPPQELPTTPGVIAISATDLQGVFATAQVDTRSYYAPYRNKKPMTVLGGSIYLFLYP